MGEYNALHEAQRQTIAKNEAQEASKFLQNNSAEGDRKLWNEIIDLYKRYGKPEDSAPDKFDGMKTASDAMYKLKDMSKGKISGEDSDKDGILEITELFVKDHSGNWTYFAPKPQQDAGWWPSWGKSNSQNPLEGAVRNIKDRDALIENPHR